MKINNIGPTNFGAGVKIYNAENNSCKYLYYEVNKLTSEFKIPANFRTHVIELPSTSAAILAKLRELGIKFCDK